MLKNKLEALLFSSGRKMDIEELSKLTNERRERIQKALEELKKEHDDKESSTMLVNEGDFWKLTVREQYLPLVRNIVTETELSRTILETLAVIAFKYPIKQSDLISLRTNKAYDHLKELEEMGYITRQKHGRTNLIKLTQKFFDYFDLPEENLKEQFQDFGSIAKAIEEKEREVKEVKQKQKEEAQSIEQKEEKIKQGIESLDAPEISVKEEKLGNLEIVDEPTDEQLELERERLAKLKQEDTEKVEPKARKFKGPGIKTTSDMEREIDAKVERILHPKEEAEEEPKKEARPKQSRDEPKDLLEASMEENEDKEPDSEDQK